MSQLKQGNKMVKRLLVCGGRDVTDTGWVFSTLDRLQKAYGFDVVIEGDAKGADRIAGYWARKNRLTNLKFPANWEQHGKRAGPIRNQQMLDEGQPDMGVAFDGGIGTYDMIRRLKNAGVYCEHYLSDPNRIDVI